MHEQVTIFEVMDVRIFDAVMIRAACDSDDVETYYYLESFQGKTGEVIKRLNRQPNQFEVAFEGIERNGIFNVEELEILRKE